MLKKVIFTLTYVSIFCIGFISFSFGEEDIKLKAELLKATIYAIKKDFDNYMKDECIAKHDEKINKFKNCINFFEKMRPEDYELSSKKVVNFYAMCKDTKDLPLLYQSWQVIYPPSKVKILVDENLGVGYTYIKEKKIGQLKRITTYEVIGISPLIGWKNLSKNTPIEAYVVYCYDPLRSFYDGLCIDRRDVSVYPEHCYIFIHKILSER